MNSKIKYEEYKSRYLLHKQMNGGGGTIVTTEIDFNASDEFPKDYYTRISTIYTDFFTSFNYDRFCALYYSIKKIQSPVTKEEFINTENMTLEDANECSGGICFTQAYVLRDRLVKVGFRNAYVIGVWDEHQKISTFPVVKHLAVLIVGKKDGVTTYIFLDGSTNVSSPIEFASENDTKVLNNHTFILNVKKRALINYNAPYHLILDFKLMDVKNGYTSTNQRLLYETTVPIAARDSLGNTIGHVCLFPSEKKFQVVDLLTSNKIEMTFDELIRLTDDKGDIMDEPLRVLFTHITTLLHKDPNVLMNRIRYVIQNIDAFRANIVGL